MIKVACLQYNNSYDIEANLLKLDALISKMPQVDLLCLPENVFCMPISFEQLWQDSQTMDDNRFIKWAQNIAKNHQCDILIGSIAIKEPGFNKLFNRSIYIDSSGKILEYYDKIHLFDANVKKGEVYRESKNFHPGEKLKIVNSKHGIIGLSICYDARFPHMFRKMAQMGAGILMLPAAFTYTTGKLHWHVLTRARAIENCAYVLAPALCGVHNDKRQTYGHSLIISPQGEILAEGSESGNEIIYADIDPEEVKTARLKVNNLKLDSLE